MQNSNRHNIVFTVKDFYYSSDSVFTAASFEGIDIGAGFVSMGLGFCMSLLFMIDQHECAGLVAIPENKYVCQLRAN